jgi:hypothetical protein
MNTRILISDPAGKTVATTDCHHRLDSFDTGLIRDHATRVAIKNSSVCRKLTVGTCIAIPPLSGLSARW